MKKSLVYTVIFLISFVAGYFYCITLQWQTLIAGLLALCGALATIDRMSRQNFLTQEMIQIELANQERKTAAINRYASAKLLYNIDLLYDYAQNAKIFICEVEAEKKAVIPEAPPLINFFDETVFADEKISTHLTESFKTLQVLKARLRSVKAKSLISEDTLRQSFELEISFNQLLAHIRDGAPLETSTKEQLRSLITAKIDFAIIDNLSNEAKGNIRKACREYIEAYKENRLVKI